MNEVTEIDQVRSGMPGRPAVFFQSALPYENPCAVPLTVPIQGSRESDR